MDEIQLVVPYLFDAGNSRCLILETGYSLNSVRVHDLVLLSSDYSLLHYPFSVSMRHAHIALIGQSSWFGMQKQMAAHSCS